MINKLLVDLNSALSQLLLAENALGGIDGSLHYNRASNKAEAARKVYDDALIKVVAYSTVLQIKATPPAIVYAVMQCLSSEFAGSHETVMKVFADETEAECCVIDLEQANEQPDDYSYYVEKLTVE